MVLNPWTSYATVKYVVIPDRRLALLKVFLTALIIVYVVVVELVAKNGYLQTFPVKGVVRFSLRQPTLNGCQPTSDSSCQNDFLPLSQLPYCSQHYQNKNVTSATVLSTKTQLSNSQNDSKNLATLSISRQQRVSSDFSTIRNIASYKGPVYPCQIYEAMNAHVMRETSVVVWTRAKTYNQTLACRNEDILCPQTYQTHNSPDPFFLAQPEAFTLLLEHSVTSSTLCRNEQAFQHHSATSASSSSSSSSLPLYACSAQAQDYHGRLLSHSADLCAAEYASGNAFDSPSSNNTASKPPCYIGPNHTVDTHQDFFSLEILLKAAGVHLDDCYHKPKHSSQSATTILRKQKNDATCDTIRNQGGTLLLEIFWDDAVSWEGKVEPYYSYRAQWIGGAYKESQAFYYHSYRQDRILLESHGIKVAVVLGGTFHHFQMLQFLITLTTALGLLAVASVIVDNLMLYILPDKDTYLEAKYGGPSREDSSVLPQASNTSRGISLWRPLSRSRNSNGPRRRRAGGQEGSSTRPSDADSIGSGGSSSRPPTHREQASLLQSIVHREESSNNLNDADSASREPLLSQVVDSSTNFNV